MDLLPGALAGAWDGKPPKTTVGRLYAALKSARGRPWPTRQFIDVLNEAVNQGALVRGAAGPQFGSVTADMDRELRLPPAGVQGSHQARRTPVKGLNSKEVCFLALK